MYFPKKMYTKELLWVMCGQLLAFLGFAFGMRIFTDLLPPDKYGQVALALTAATFVNQISFGPIAGAAVRFFVPALEAHQIQGYLRSVFKLSNYATLSIVLIVILSTFILFVINSHDIHKTIVLVSVIFAILAGYIGILNGILSAARLRSIVAMHQSTESWLRIIFGVGFICLFDATGTSLLLGYVLSGGLILGSLLFNLNNIKKKSVKKNMSEHQWLVQIWKFSWPFSAWGIFTSLHAASDKWALQYFTSLTEVGKYTVLYQIGYYPITLLSGMLLQFLIPVLYERAGDSTDPLRVDNAYRINYAAVKITLFMTLLIFAFTSYCHELIFDTFVSSGYGDISHMLPWMVLAGGIMASAQTMINNLLVDMRITRLMIIKIILAIFGVVINIIGAKFFGIFGVVFAVNIFSIILLLSILKVTKEVKK